LNQVSPKLRVRSSSPEQQLCCADVIVVDVGHDEEVDVSTSVRIERDGQRPPAQRGVVSSGPVSISGRQVRPRIGQDTSRQTPKPAGRRRG
jgi:hypothetical protein